MAYGDPDRRLVRIYPREDIAAAVRRLAGEVDRDYQDRPPLLVGILKGAFIFLADLVREMKIPPDGIEFLRLSSYGESTVSSGRARVAMGLPRRSVAGRDLLVVDDIVDTGITTAAALKYLARHRPASLKVCALLDKPSRRRVPVHIDYLGFTVEDRFLVGYGLDLGQRYRHLPEIYAVEENHGPETAHHGGPGRPGG
jgi:hypoxanthine phosphoribosyltransferase